MSPVETYLHSKKCCYIVTDVVKPIAGCVRALLVPSCCDKFGTSCYHLVTRLMMVDCYEIVINLLRADNIRIVGTTWYEFVGLINLVQDDDSHLLSLLSLGTSSANTSC